MKHNVFTLILVGLFMAGSVFANTVPDQPHLKVSGQSKVTAVPDRLQISLNLTEVGQDVGAARQTVEKHSQQLIDTLKAFGVNKRDITAARLDITPHYNWNNQAQIYSGTEVSRQIDVTLRDLAQYDELIKAIIDAKVARIDNSSLESSREKELRREALQAAIADARQKAEQLAAGFEAKVGPVYAVTGGGSGYQPQERYGISANMDRISAFEPGEINFSESIQVVFYLLP